MTMTDTITRQFVTGCGIVELPSGVIVQEPIRAMTPTEVKEREDLRIANTTEKQRAKVVAYRALTNGSDYVSMETRRTIK